MSVVTEEKKELDETLDVSNVKSCSGLIEKKERASSRAFDEVWYELQTLSFSSREVTERVTEGNVPEAKLFEHTRDASNQHLIFEKLSTGIDAHREDLVYVFSFIANLKDRCLEPLPQTRLALNEDITQKLHVFPYKARAFARWAPTSIDVEREGGTRQSTRLCLLSSR
jgi:hypothetical protein